MVDHFDISRETVALAINYCDRYFHQNRKQELTAYRLGLTIITAAFIAIKMKDPSMEDVKKESILRSLCTSISSQGGPLEPKDVVEMEKEMFQTLEWRLNAPTMHEFVDMFCKSHPLRNNAHYLEYLYEKSCWLVERALFHRGMMKYKPSVVALAAILIISEHQFDEILTDHMMMDFLELPTSLNMDDNQVNEAMAALENLEAEIIEGLSEPVRPVSPDPMNSQLI